MDAVLKSKLCTHIKYRSCVNLGGEIMRKFKFIFMSMLILTVFVPVNASATQQSVGGGIWDYGKNSIVWSKYYNKSVKHGSSLKDENTKATKKVTVEKGKWSDDCWWWASTHRYSYYWHKG